MGDNFAAMVGHESAAHATAHAIGYDGLVRYIFRALVVSPMQVVHEIASASKLRLPLMLPLSGRDWHKLGRLVLHPAQQVSDGIQMYPEAASGPCHRKHTPHVDPSVRVLSPNASHVHACNKMSFHVVCGWPSCHLMSCESSHLAE